MLKLCTQKNASPLDPGPELAQLRSPTTDMHQQPTAKPSQPAGRQHIHAGMSAGTMVRWCRLIRIALALVSDPWCPILCVRSFVSDPLCPILCVRSFVSDPWCPILGVRSLVSDPLCPILCVRSFVSDPWCPILCVRSLVSDPLCPVCMWKSTA